MSSVYTVDPTILTVKGGSIFNQQDIDKTAAILGAVPPNFHVPEHCVKKGRRRKNNYLFY
jgi:hypothetical protein